MTLLRRTALPCLLAALSFLPARLPAETAPVPIRGGESRSMALQVEAGQFLGLVVDQEGIDLVVELRDPDGRTAVETDGPDYWWWEEEVAWVAERSGVHEVVVRALLPDAAPGTYRLRMDGPRAPRPEDQARLQATGEMREAHALILQPGKDAERLGHLETALPLWQGL